MGDEPVEVKGVGDLLTADSKVLLDAMTTADEWTRSSCFRAMGGGVE